MPKKFAGENSKAVAARARKAAQKEEEHAKKQQQLEDEMWRDDDKHIVKKQQRKEEQARKKQILLEKKAESKALLEQEMVSIQPTAKQPLSKITRAQIEEENEKRRLAAVKSKPEVETHLSKPLEENINRVMVDGEEARTVEEAIAVLSVKSSDVDKHPEKRLKAAFTAFEEANLPRIKSENPTLRLSQLKQILRKEWMRSPDNPLNQRLSS
ncbi:coiled-coil domain-containing protein 124 [Anabrus simplex]|uniref:coiled-coil domain-containing protein 124 n=1 Tax=Anabrus simplex TaxID=316456 RepID=UPI0034DD8993